MTWTLPVPGPGPASDATNMYWPGPYVSQVQVTLLLSIIYIYMITSSQCSTVQSTCGFTLSVHYTGGKIASSLLALLLAQHITTVEFYYLHRLQHTHHRASETKLELFQIVRVIIIIYNLLFQIFHKLRISAWVQFTNSDTIFEL